MNIVQIIGLFALWTMFVFIVGYAVGGFVVVMDLETGRRKPKNKR